MGRERVTTLLNQGRGATVSRPWVRLFEVAICDLKRVSGGRVADASLPDAIPATRHLRMNHDN